MSMIAYQMCTYYDVCPMFHVNLQLHLIRLTQEFHPACLQPEAGGGGRTGDRCSEPGRRLVTTTLTRLGAQWRAVRRGDNMLPASAAAARLLLGLALLPASSHQQDPVCDAT